MDNKKAKPKAKSPSESSTGRTDLYTDDSGRVVNLDRMVQDQSLGDRPFSRPAQSRNVNSTESIFEKIKNSSNEPIPVNIECPICKRMIDNRSLRRHILLEHPRQHRQSPQISKQKQTHFSNPSSRPVENDKPIRPDKPNGTSLANCPCCNALVRRDRLQRHLRKVHADEGHARPTEMESKPDESVTLQTGERLTGEVFVDWLNRFNRIDDEPRDGSKYIGWMSREGGRFGSYPLHDDYSDESDGE